MKKTVYIFNCSIDRNLFAFTGNINGNNIPSSECNGKWVKYRIIKIGPKSPALNGLEREQIAKAIDMNGFYIAHLSLDFLGKKD